MYDTGAIGELSAQVNELARTCARLNEENAELRKKMSALSAPRSPAAGLTPPPPAAEPGDPSERAGRGIDRRAVGAALVGAAAGVVGASVLSDLGNHQAGGASGKPMTTGKTAHAELTAVTQASSAASISADRHISGMVAPTIVKLDDAPRIIVNAALGNDFRVTLGGHRTFDNPAGGVDGQRITFTICQGSGAPHKASWSDGYRFGLAGVPVLSASAGSADVIGFIYNKSLGSWLCVGAARGF